LNRVLTATYRDVKSAPTLIAGMAELSSAGNTFATTGGQFQMPMTIIGAGGTAPNQSLGAEHSQPFHAYIMGIPGRGGVAIVHLGFRV
jgi:pyruvate/2-oxoglutarate/acetoin dehydrogenase E1 component